MEQLTKNALVWLRKHDGALTVIGLTIHGIKVFVSLERVAQLMATFAYEELGY